MKVSQVELDSSRSPQHEHLPSKEAVVSINDRCGLRKEVHHRNLPNKSKLALCKPLLSLQESLE